MSGVLDSFTPLTLTDEHTSFPLPTLTNGLLSVGLLDAHITVTPLSVSVPVDVTPNTQFETVPLPLN